MKLTPEQEFLKAIALSATLDYINLPKRDVEEYLALLEQNQSEATEKVKPAWTPEVGKLCRDEDGIYEIIENVGIYRVKDILDGSFCDYPMTFEALARDYEPIAELEGLKVGDSVYGIAYQKYTHPWRITGITGSLIFIKKHGESVILTLNKHGFSYEIGSTQLFWRTADRVERFGKSAG